MGELFLILFDKSFKEFFFIENNALFDISNLTIGSSAVLDVRTSANLYINGNTSTLSGASVGKLLSSGGTGNIIFNGTSGTQNIAFQIGDSANRINIITIDTTSDGWMR